MADTSQDKDLEAVITETERAMEECKAGKVWYKSKTVWTAIIMAAVWGISIALGFIDNHYYAAVLTLVSLVLGLALRKLTGGGITLTDIQAVVTAAENLKSPPTPPAPPIVPEGT